MRDFRPFTAWARVGLALGAAGLLAVSCGSDDSAPSRVGDAGSAGLGDAGSSGFGVNTGGAPPAAAGSSGAPGGQASELGGAAAFAGATGGAGAPAIGIELDELCQLLPDMMCAWVDRCRFWTNRTCGDWWGTDAVDVLCSEGVKAVDAGLLEYDPLEGRRCLEESRALSCHDQFGTPYVATGSGACARMLKGTVEANGDCYLSYLTTDECQPGLYCSMSDSCPGSCKPRLEAGADCSGEQCVAGYQCVADQCAPAPKEGEPCGTCGDGLLCRPSELAGARVCSRLVAEGESCSHSGECPYQTSCLGGKCRHAAAAGEVCSSPSQCPDGFACIADDVGVGTCQAAPGEDQDCDQGGHCGNPFDCISLQAGGAKCAKVGFDEACDVDSCPGGFCSEGLCVPLLGEGEPCTGKETDFHRECEVGFSCIPVDTSLTSFACQAPGTVGAACAAAFHCSREAYCNLKTHECEAALKLDQPCAAEGSCEPPLRCTAGKCQPATAGKCYP
jgi:hypothetical protein